MWAFLDEEDLPDRDVEGGDEIEVDGSSSCVKADLAVLRVVFRLVADLGIQPDHRGPEDGSTAINVNQGLRLDRLRLPSETSAKCRQKLIKERLPDDVGAKEFLDGGGSNPTQGPSQRFQLDFRVLRLIFLHVH